MAAAPPAAGTRWSLGAFAPALVPAALFVWTLSLLPEIAAGERLRSAWDWVPSLGITLSFLIDGLSLTFAMLITGIGALVMLYSDQYLAGHPHYRRFMGYLTAFMLSMLGLVTADNLIALFVFWELTSVTSYLLIGFDHASAKSRRSALQALLLTGAGGLALLAGFILMAEAGGSYELSAILAQPGVLTDHPWYLGILILVLAGAFTKSAQVPFHVWLPNAMAAPTPVSAYLHSATMVKAGVYLLARLHPGLGGTEVWLWTLTVVGAATAVFASVMALRQSDLKQALAYTTLMALGTLTLFLSSSADVAITAAVTFLIVHSLYKASLFLAVGNIDHATGTREVARLRGLARALPVTAGAAALSALSMAGFPPFLGFIGKELKYKGALAVASEPWLVAGAVLAANALMFAAAAVVAFRPFWGRGTAEAEPGFTPHEAPWPMWIGPVLLAAGGVVLGLAPWLAAVLVDPAVAAILPAGEAYELKLWHGVNLPLMLSFATFALGIGLYLASDRLRAALAALEARSPVDFDRGWDRVLDGLKAVAAWQTRLVQSGDLRTYLRITFLTLLLALGGTMLARGAISVPLALPDPLIKQWAVVALIALGTGLVVATDSRVAAIAGLGVVGIGVALVFIIYGAPDVAITQLLVETLVVVLVAVVLLRLPQLTREAPVRRRLRDLGLAGGLGVATTALTLMVLEGPIDRRLTDYFEVTAWPEAHGRNVVNVILVDFRALDTFGEIAVVLIAALSAVILLKGIRREGQE
jgi:multicomponent Na+:H+ antiporter subunit A